MAFFSMAVVLMYIVLGQPSRETLYRFVDRDKGMITYTRHYFTVLYLFHPCPLGGLGTPVHFTLPLIDEKPARRILTGPAIHAKQRSGALGVRALCARGFGRLHTASFSPRRWSPPVFRPQSRGSVLPRSSRRAWRCPAAKCSVSGSSSW